MAWGVFQQVLRGQGGLSRQEDKERGSFIGGDPWKSSKNFQKSLERGRSLEQRSDAPSLIYPGLYNQTAVNYIKNSPLTRPCERFL